jgi:transcriptional regulator with XRE-family HTH domain
MEKTNISAIDQYIIDAVKAKRIEKGYSQAQLANLLDVSIGFIGNTENPKYRTKYNFTLINELARVFECSPRDFLPEKPVGRKRVSKSK